MAWHLFFLLFYIKIYSSHSNLPMQYVKRQKESHISKYDRFSYDAIENISHFFIDLFSLFLSISLFHSEFQCFMICMRFEWKTVWKHVYIYIYTQWELIVWHSVTRSYCLFFKRLCFVCNLWPKCLIILIVQIAHKTWHSRRWNNASPQNERKCTEKKWNKRKQTTK